MPELPENTPGNSAGNSNRSKTLSGFPLSFLVVFLCLFIFLGFMAFRLVQTSQEERDNQVVNEATTTKPTPAPTSSGTVNTNKYILFTPNANALLSRETVTDTSVPANAPYSEKARHALELLFPKLDFLPKGTKLRAAPLKEKDGTVRVDLSKEFKQLDSQPETPVMLTLDAMAYTLGALESKDGKTVRPVKVRILVDGQRVRVLSQFSLDEPWKASESDSGAPDAEDAV